MISLLGRHPAIAEVCVFAIPDPVAGEIVGVAVKLSDGAEELPDSFARVVPIAFAPRGCTRTLVRH